MRGPILHNQPVAVGVEAREYAAASASDGMMGASASVSACATLGPALRQTNSICYILAKDALQKKRHFDDSRRW
jgi:hypothetical protein